MPLQATSGAASYDAFGGGVPVAANYIEDVFSTWLYTGNGSTQTITNGIDLSTKGGLVWIKGRTLAYNNYLFDTARGTGKSIISNRQNAEATSATTLTAFDSTGFSIGSESEINDSASTYVSWTFREQAKFFDVVTWSGNSVSGRLIPQSLGSAPGCIIVKNLTVAGTNWAVWHRSLATGYVLQLQGTNAAFNTKPQWFNSSTQGSSTTFEVGNDTDTNETGNTYVAYVFAHNAGGFGLTGTDNVVSCGSYTGNGSTTGPVIDLGYEPQWVMVKNTTTTGTAWRMFDSMRGFTTDGVDNALAANSSAAETTYTAVAPTATGFRLTGVTGDPNRNGDAYIYIAVRRGPMKVPTTGTSVYETGFDHATLEDPTIRLSNLSYVDAAFSMRRTSPDSDWPQVGSRLTQGEYLRSSSTGASVSSTGKWTFNFQNGFGGGAWDNDVVAWCFKRASGFMDVCCYTGTGVTSRAITHNLTVVPEMIIYKSRSLGAEHWGVYTATTGIGKTLWLDAQNNVQTLSERILAVSSSTFTVGDNDEINQSAATYVAYLFATCPGVSKVGGYTGTGTTQTINCGFTAGARFVLIKRTDSTSDWYVWDTARGIVSGNDPYLLLNSTAAEVTNTDYIDTASTGFELSSTAPAAINASGGAYIFLAIA
jgi:hypothetical protein